MATVLLVFSGLGLAFTEPIAVALVGLVGGGQGSWDPKTEQMVRSLFGATDCDRSRRHPLASP